MPAIPRTHQYYPSVPLSELSDLYSKGDNRLNSHSPPSYRVFAISFLPKVLRLDRRNPYNNKYMLFVENTSMVDEIKWQHDLYLNNVVIHHPGFQAPGPNNETEYEIILSEDMLDDYNNIVADKLVVSCKVRLGRETIELSMEHTFIQGLDSELGLGGPVADPKISYAGNPVFTNILVNQFGDYLSQDILTWNGHVIENNTANQDMLLKVITGLLYFLTPNFYRMSGKTLYDLNDFTNPMVKDQINDGVVHEGVFTNGFLHLPLHILNDIFSLIGMGSIPDFANIDTSTSNKVFEMFKLNDPVSFRGLMQQIKIVESKGRLVDNANIDKYVELFNLTLFPKSAVKLAAILVKYLFECSKKNNCNECLNRIDAWTTLSLDKLKDNQDFLKNILTHYFNDPSNKIERFPREADVTNTLIWNPAIHGILNVSPRVTKAYFAKKVVTQINAADYVFDFERIDSPEMHPPDPEPTSMLGRQIYLIVETLHSRKHELTINISPGDITLTGNTNILTLASGGELTDFLADIIKTVGNYDDLRNKANDDFSGPAKEYFRIDHQDKAILKLRIRPDSRDSFKAWANRLGAKTTSFVITPRYSDNTPAIFGNDIATARMKAEFLGTSDPYQSRKFLVGNRNVYEIYHGENKWNFLNSNKRIGKVKNVFIDEIKNDTPDSPKKMAEYLYYDNLDNEHFVCKTRIHKIKRKKKIGVVPSDKGAIIDPPVSYAANRLQYERIDAINLKFHEKGTYVEGGANVPRRPNPIPPNINDITKTGWYENVSLVYDKELVDADIVAESGIGDKVFRGLDYQSIDGSLRIGFNYQHTRKRYSNPDLFSGLLGALAQQYYRDNSLVLLITALSYEDGSGYPSIEHVNGEAIDVDYFRDPDTQRLINDLIDYGFEKFIVGYGMTYRVPSGAPSGIKIIKDLAANGLHSTHLHCTKFNSGNIHSIIGP